MELKRSPDFLTQDIEARMLENYQFLMTGLLPYLPTLKRAAILPDITAVFSDYDDNTFNYVLNAKFSLQNAYDNIQRVIRFYQERQLPLAWYVSAQDTPANLFLLLKEKGFTHKETNVAMYLDLRFSTFEKEHPLEFKRAFDTKMLEDFDKVTQSVGESPHWEPLFQHLPPLVFNEEFPIEYHVGYKNGEPITSGIAVMYAGVTGIYYIGTQPSEQRKGYAKAMMYHLFERAQHRGFPLITLQATVEGQYLYEKLGFQAFSYLHEYNLDPPLKGESHA